MGTYQIVIQVASRTLSRIESGGNMVKGVEFVIDDSGQKKAVVIDLKQHGEVWEDFYDTLRTKERESEPRESLNDVKEKVLGRH
jgi:hypothetical protein